MNFFKKKKILYRAKRRFKQKAVTSNDSISAVVFTMDRPIQLHSLLESYYTYTTNPAPVTIIYRCSDNNFQKGYDELIMLWKDVRFVKETNFRTTLRDVLNSLPGTKVFFLVDDIIFTRNYDLAHISKVDCKKFVPSLRLGKNINYSYVRKKEITPPPFEMYDDQLISWIWSEKNSYWSYPLSVDGHIFLLDEIKILLDLSDFKAPNSFEESIQIFNPVYFKRRGVSFQQSVLLNTPWNMVQTEIENKNENIGKDYLLAQWQNGKRICFEAYHNINNKSCHEALPIELSDR
jgi:hypothetical protein